MTVDSMREKNRPIQRVLVIGAGTMGGGIAQHLAQAGLDVILVDREKHLIAASLERINANLNRLLEFDLLTKAPQSVISKIEPLLSSSLSEVLGDCDFVIETIPEVLDLKKQLFSVLDTCPENVILASNTSSINVSVLSEGLQTPPPVADIGGSE